MHGNWQGVTISGFVCTIILNIHICQMPDVEIRKLNNLDIPLKSKDCVIFESD